MTANESAKAPSAAPFSTTMSARVAPSVAWISVSGRIRSVIAIATTPSLKAMIRSTLASRSYAICSPSLSSDQLPPLAMAKYRSVYDPDEITSNAHRRRVRRAGAGLHTQPHARGPGVRKEQGVVLGRTTSTPDDVVARVI